MNDLERAVAVLIRAGHTVAWDYPHGVFMSALEELEESFRGDARPSS